jgi:transcriptional regulator with XRE-family HTH domain
MNLKDLGPLQAARKARGLTQTEFAERSGVRQANISAYELGTKTLGMGAAKRLADALDGNAALLELIS